MTQIHLSDVNVKECRINRQVFIIKRLSEITVAILAGLIEEGDNLNIYETASQALKFEQYTICNLFETSNIYEELKAILSDMQESLDGAFKFNTASPFLSQIPLQLRWFNIVRHIIADLIKPLKIVINGINDSHKEFQVTYSIDNQDWTLYCSNDKAKWLTQEHPVPYQVFKFTVHNISNPKLCSEASLIYLLLRSCTVSLALESLLESECSGSNRCFPS